MAAATNTETQETPEYRTFRQNYGTLYNAIQDPLTLATRLFADNIITSAVKEEMSAMGRTRLDKNEALLNAVGTKIRIDPSKLEVFLSTLDEDPPMQSLAESMRADFRVIMPDQTANVQNGHGRNSTDGPGPLSSMLSQADEVMEHASSQANLEGAVERRQGYGRYPAITLNNNNIVVAVRNSLLWFTLKSRVGVVSEGDTIHWGQEEKFGYGYYSRVSLNNNNMIVEVHGSHYKRTVSYCVGKVDVDARAIGWGESHDIGQGRAPAVALTDSGSVVVVYENAYGFYKSYYRVGTLDTEHKRIEWAKEAQLYGSGIELSVAMKDDGTVIEVHRSALLFRLQITVGRLGVDNQGNILGKIKWSSPKTYGHGYYPYVSLNGEGKAVEVHQSLFFRRLIYRTGIAYKEENAFQWTHGQQPYNLGWAPVVALNDHNKFIECHETNSAYKGNSIWYKIGTLEEL